MGLIFFFADSETSFSRKSAKPRENGSPDNKDANAGEKRRVCCVTIHPKENPRSALSPQKKVERRKFGGPHINTLQKGTGGGGSEQSEKAEKGEQSVKENSVKKGNRPTKKKQKTAKARPANVTQAQESDVSDWYCFM